MRPISDSTSTASTMLPVSEPRRVAARPRLNDSTISASVDSGTRSSRTCAALMGSWRTMFDSTGERVSAASARSICSWRLNVSMSPSTASVDVP